MLRKQRISLNSESSDTIKCCNLCSLTYQVVVTAILNQTRNRLRRYSQMKTTQFLILMKKILIMLCCWLDMLAIQMVKLLYFAEPTNVHVYYKEWRKNWHVDGQCQSIFKDWFDAVLTANIIFVYVSINYRAMSIAILFWTCNYAFPPMLHIYLTVFTWNLFWKVGDQGTSPPQLLQTKFVCFYA